MNRRRSIETPEGSRTRVAYGAVGGPRFSTDIVEKDGGDENRESELEPGARGLLRSTSRTRPRRSATTI
jgi:hypothetical protein